MKLTFSDVVDALGAVFVIRDQGRSAFASRIKHLQRLGMLPDLNTGRGRAATYAPEHLFLIGTAMQLNEVSASPDRAVQIITSQIPVLAMGLSEAVQFYREPKGKSMFFAVQGLGLEGLKKRHPLSESTWLFPMSSDTIARGDLGAFNAVSILNVSRLINRLHIHFNQSEEFLEALTAWADKHSMFRPVVANDGEGELGGKNVHKEA